MSVALRPQAAMSTTRLNGALLCCNLALVLINLLLAVRTGEAAAVRSDVAARGPAGRRSAAAVHCSRVLQTLGQGEEPALTGDRVRAILDAVSCYRETIERGFESLLHFPADTNLASAFAELIRDARAEVEMTLGAKFTDVSVVQRLTTAVIRSSQ